MRKSLPIVWQRLVNSSGQTCVRCEATFEGLKLAVEKLEESLRPLDIELTVDIREVDIDSFKTDPAQSNRIWIAGKPIEEWLSANVSSSKCCNVCGNSECRTIQLGDDVFESIPSDLILKAALIAAAQMVGPDSQDRIEKPGSLCCGD